MTLFVAGLSHKNAPVELREQLAVEEDKLRELLRDVAATGAVQETLILSTCNRVEVYGVAEAPGEARTVVFRHLCRNRGLSHASIEPLLYTHVDDDAVRHAFRVAASLDSMLIGEPQILGQVKDAFALAQACETVGPALHTLFTQAFAVGKRVRSDPEIARHAVPAWFPDVEGSVNTLDAVYCYDIDDLKQVVEANIRERLREAQRAEALVEREVAKFLARRGDVEVIPTIVSLRERLEEIRVGEVRKALARLPAASPETRAAIEALSAGIVNKILHAPITKLRESSRAGAHRSWLALVHELFGLGRRP